MDMPTRYYMDEAVNAQEEEVEGFTRLVADVVAETTQTEATGHRPKPYRGSRATQAE